MSLAAPRPTRVLKGVRETSSGPRRAGPLSVACSLATPRPGGGSHAGSHSGSAGGALGGPVPRGTVGGGTPGGRLVSLPFSCPLKAYALDPECGQVGQDFCSCPG